MIVAFVTSIEVGYGSFNSLGGGYKVIGLQTDEIR